MSADERTDVAALREALAKAERRPWVVEHARIWSGEPNPNKTELLMFRGSREWRHDAALIVAAVNALPTLLDELDTARATIARVEALAEPYSVITRESFEGGGWTPDEVAGVYAAHLRAALALAHDITEAS